MLRKGSKDPYKALSTGGLIYDIMMLKKCSFDLRQQFRVLSKHLMEANHNLVGEMRLLQFVVSNKVDQQCLTHLRQSQCDISEDLHCLPGHLNVDMCSIVIEFVEEIT